MSMTPSRRRFLQTAAGAAALSITTSARSFGNTHVLQVAANLPCASRARPPAAGVVSAQDQAGAGEDGRAQSERAGAAQRSQRGLHHRVFSSADRAPAGRADSGVGRTGAVRARSRVRPGEAVVGEGLSKFTSTIPAR